MFKSIILQVLSMIVGLLITISCNAEFIQLTCEGSDGCEGPLHGTYLQEVENREVFLWLHDSRVYVTLGTPYRGVLKSVKSFDITWPSNQDIVFSQNELDNCHLLVHVDISEIWCKRCYITKACTSSPSPKNTYRQNRH